MSSECDWSDSNDHGTTLVIGLVLLVFDSSYKLSRIQHRLVQYSVILDGYPSKRIYIHTCNCKTTLMRALGSRLDTGLPHVTGLQRLVLHMIDFPGPTIGLGTRLMVDKLITCRLTSSNPFLFQFENIPA